MNTEYAGGAGRRIVLGVCGGVAAYKSCELARLLVKAGFVVDVVMTAAAQQFVGPASFAAISGRPVHVGHGDAVGAAMAHIDLSRGAAAVLTAPATANFLAKLAAGVADDLLTTLCLASEAPLLAAPAMNRLMWEHPSTQRNAAQLAADGVILLGPASGVQACGETGPGRMLEASELFAALQAHLAPQALLGKRVVLTAGPTFEAIDPVRGLTNGSSGRMGFALARACAEAGAETILVAGPVALATPPGVRRIDVRSALEMRAAVQQQLPADMFIAVAAVADYRPATPSEHKMKKGAATLSLDLVANPDILAEVAASPNAPFCIGFAAESRDLEGYAEAKRKAKGAPLLVGNLIADGLGGDDNKITLFDDAGAHTLPAADKLTLARAIVRHAVAMIDTRQDACTR